MLPLLAPGVGTAPVSPCSRTGSGGRLTPWHRIGSASSAAAASAAPNIYGWTHSERTELVVLADTTPAARDGFGEEFGVSSPSPVTQHLLPE
jgi:hypothetical protein